MAEKTLTPLFISGFSGDTILYVPAAIFSNVSVVPLVPVTAVAASFSATADWSATFMRPTADELLPPVLLTSIVSVAVPVTVNSIPPVKALSTSIALTLPSLLVLLVTLPTDLKYPSPSRVPSSTASLSLAAVSVVTSNICVPSSALTLIPPPAKVVGNRPITRSNAITDAKTRLNNLCFIISSLKEFLACIPKLWSQSPLIHTHVRL